MTTMQGRLIVKVIEAKLSRDTDWFTKMDPYCVIRCGPDTKRTAVHYKAGKTPSWNELFEFSRNTEQTIDIEVWDSDPITSDDYVAGAIIPLTKVLQAGYFTDWYELIYKGRYSGQIHIEMTWLPLMTQKPPQAGPYYPIQTVYPPNQPFNPYSNPADYTNPQGFVQSKSYPGQYVYKNGVYVYIPYPEYPGYQEYNPASQH